MIDFHSHILPEIDDGAQSVEESLEMLRMLKSQGVNTVCLTPHYLAMDESPDEFLVRREEAFKKLKSAINESDEEFQTLLLGAEVYYYPGICKMEELKKLTLDGTDLLLLEMPMASFGEFAIREIEELTQSSQVQVVIAHIERCIKFQKKGTLERLLDCGVMFQVNASFFNSRKTKRKALNMFKEGTIHFIGSDCHNIKYRPPKIGEAVDIITDKFSKDSLDEFFNNQKEYLN
ncbi:MAG: capsular polysaccharide biosynthesis protein [Ruminococcus sp.]|nr:capsular polysaccharide biosynthesis protein [Ruminococcus sp.]